MAQSRCPICNRTFDPDRSPAMPFCSHRCKQIDLGHWLKEKYGLPIEPDEEAEASQRPAEEQTEGP